jgi:DNA polymerase III subunit epsilon
MRSAFGQVTPSPAEGFVRAFDNVLAPMIWSIPLPNTVEERLAVAALEADALLEAELAREKELAQTDLWSCPFSVVDIETTGSIAGRDGLTEIALVQVAEGKIVHTWRSFVNPCVPIPTFITHLTGISDDMVSNAPPVRDLLPTIVGLIGDAILVGHNVRFDAGFIDFELRRHGYRPLKNPKVDTLTLARRTIAQVANYKLGTLTRELGLDVERHHRALADAKATAELLVHCIKRLEDCGVFTYGTLLEFLRTRPLRKKSTAARASGSVSQLAVWTSILRNELLDVPGRPGVYLLKDAGNSVVYVGKSRNLRQRLRAYAGGAKPAGAKICALRGVVASFDYLVTGSELEALLLEAELVRKHNPQFNDRLRNFREFSFLKVEPGPYGRLVTTTRLVADGARYYGPYRSTPSARAAVSALQDALGLRSFDANVDANEFPSLPIGQHEALIDEAIAFIEGAADDVMLAVARRRDEAAARNKPEVSDREEQRLERLRRLRARHSALEAATGLNVVVMAPSAAESEEACFLFCGGRLVAQGRLPRRLPHREQAHRLLADLIAEHYRPQDAARSFARQEEIDQLFILAAWHRERREGLCYVELPSRAPTSEEAAAWAGAVLDGQSAIA